MVYAHDPDSPSGRSSAASGSSSLLDALLVHAETLVEAAHAVVLGDCGLGLAERLLELGARAVHVYDPDAARVLRASSSLRGDRRIVIRELDGDLDVRDGAFDLALVPDIGHLRDPSSMLGRLRRAVSTSGAVVAMGRARLDVSAEEEATPYFAALAPAKLAYAELYDLFALQFENVTMTGVLPFRGVVFAELGASDEEDTGPVVSVDTRLAPPSSPSVFVVVASREPVGLEPYAIVQIGEDDARERAAEEPALASPASDEATRLASELRERLAISESQSAESSALLERALAERDAMAARASELEAVLSAAQQGIGELERRLLATEQGMVERGAELTELAALEAQLRDRAQVITALEKELLRREHLVRELVASLEEAREGVNGVAFEAAVPLPVVARPSGEDDARRFEEGRLRSKLDELAGEVARREGELAARGWRITELENERAELLARLESTPRLEERLTLQETSTLGEELSRARDELDALRQAFMKEHDARLAAESGEELVRARAELARQAALLEQMRAR